MTEESSSSISKLGRYRLLKPIGRGGMGTVFLAEDENLKREVALKVLAPKLAGNQRFVERFHREAKAAAALSHPNIVSAIDVDEASGHHFFVMEYIDGEMLKKIVDRSGPMSEEKALSICEQVAKALEHACSHQIIHRDIKPENIMLNSEGVVKLTDMGLAKNIEDQNATLTVAGTMIGTPHYASPEQIRGDTDVDGRSDIYSLGVTLFHILTGRPPFEGETGALISSQHLNSEVPSIREARPDVSETLVHLVWKMTRREREDRYQTPGDLLEEIEAIKENEDITGMAQGDVKGKGRRRPRRRRARANSGASPALFAVAAVAALAVVVFFVVGKEKITAIIKGEQPPPTNQTAVNNNMPPRKTPVTDRPPIPDKNTPALRVVKESPEVAKKLKEAFAMARKSVNEESYAQALNILAEAQAAVKTQRSRLKLLGTIDDLKKNAEKSFAAHTAKADESAAKGQTEQAIAMLRSIEGQFPPSVDEKRVEKIKEYKKKLAHAGRARKEYNALLEAFDKLVVARKYDSAKRKLDISTADMEASEYVDAVKDLRERIRLIESFWTAVRAGLKNMVGKQMTLGNFFGKVKAIDGDRVTLVRNGADFAVPISKILHWQLIDVGLKGGAKGDEDWKMGLAWLTFYEGKFKTVKTRLTRLSNKQEFSDLIQRLEFQAVGGSEKAAKKDWENLVRAVKARNWPAAGKLLASFERKFKNTDFWQSHKDLIDIIRWDSQRAHRINRLLKFEAIRAPLVAPKPPNPAGISFTVEVWVRTKQRGGVLVEHGDGAYGWALCIGRNGTPVFLVRMNSKTLVPVSGSLPIDDGNFHHLAGVLSLEDEEAALIVDGEFAHNRACGAIAKTPIDNLSIGNAGDQGSVWGDQMPHPFFGEIDEIRIWKGVRSVEKIQKEMGRSFSRPIENLMCYWNFDTSNRDLSGGENHLVIDDKARVVSEPWTYFASVAALDRKTDSEINMGGASLDSTALAGLFQGRISILKDGLVKLVYDFQNFGELKDWETDDEKQFRIVKGRLYANRWSRRKMLWHKASFTGDVQMQALVAGKSRLGCILKGDGGGFGGVLFTIGDDYNKNAMMRDLSNSKSLFETPFPFEVAKKYLFGAAVTEGSLSLSVDERRIGFVHLKTPLARTGNRVGFTAGAGSTEWDQVTIIGQLDKTWLKAALAAEEP